MQGSRLGSVARSSPCVHTMCEHTNSCKRNLISFLIHIFWQFEVYIAYLENFQEKRHKYKLVLFICIFLEMGHLGLLNQTKPGLGNMFIAFLAKILSSFFIVKIKIIRNISIPFHSMFLVFDFSFLVITLFVESAFYISKKTERVLNQARHWRLKYTYTCTTPQDNGHKNKR